MSEVPTASEVLQTTQPTPADDTFRIGAVTALFPTVNTAKVQFDGEATASEKQYAYIASYTPTVNDRVLLARIGGTWIILGGIAYNVAPTGIVITSTPGGFTIGDWLTIAGTFDHNGDRVGFFGTSPAIKQTVADPAAITAATAPATYNQTWGGQVRTDLVNLQAKLKAVTDAMQAYGLM